MKTDMNKAVIETNFSDLNLLQRGKVRDIYDLGEYLLMVATDRISAFDVIMPDPIPEKGKILTKFSLFWFKVMESIVDSHLVSGNVDEFPEICKPYADTLKDRSMLVKKAAPLPVECIIRGYISGSGWNSYLENETVCGIKIPKGLAESDRLLKPLFTPSTKAELGEHDINIDFEKASNIIGRERAEKVRDLSLLIYNKGAELAEKKGIIIADTKFEFGIFEEKIILIDEILTPDSSRFWPKESYKPGGPQKSFDKQYLRDYLSSINWDKQSPGPSLPDEVIKNTRIKYMEALTLIAGDEYAF